MPGIAEGVSMTVKILSKRYTAAGSAALWSSTCLTCTRPWVRSPVLPKIKEGGEGQEKEEVVIISHWFTDGGF